MAADSSPSLPHYFYGTVTINGVAAPAGTVILASVSGVVTGPFNPVTTTVSGAYGSADPLADVPRLLVQGNIADGAMVAFYVNGVRADQTAAWHSGDVSVLNLAVMVSSNPPDGGGGGGGVPTTTTPTTQPVTLQGITGSTPLVVDTNGNVQNDVTLTNTANDFTLTIPNQTKITLNGNPVSSLSVTPVSVATLPQEFKAANVVVLAFDFGPDGTQFVPAIDMTLSYDPSKLPSGVSEDDLSVAWWDSSTSKWVKLTGVIDKISHTITVKVEHYTDFAIISDIKQTQTTTAPSTQTSATSTTSQATTTTVTTTTGGTTATATTATTSSTTSTTSTGATSAGTTQPGQSTAAGSSTPPTSNPQVISGGFDWFWIVALIVGAVALIALIVVVLRRR